MGELLLISQNTEFLGRWFSQCGPWTSSISVTWELVTNASSQAPGDLLNQNLQGRSPAIGVSVVPQVTLVFPSRGHFEGQV